jgi:phosphatidylinositol-3-phosphatase
MKRLKILFVLFAIVFIAQSCNKQQDIPAMNVQEAITATLPKPDHIVIVILENHGYSQIIGSSSAPYINSLVSGSAKFTSSWAITHPSQPNYLDLYSGSNQGITNDNNPPNDPFTTANMGRQLINVAKTFITYSETLPSVGYNGTTYGAYARKHNPAANWMGTGTNQIPTTTNQPFTTFTSTLYTSLPTVCYIVPNQNNDMHDGSISTGDTWVKNNLNNYIQWAKTHNSLFILTFDEDNGNYNNHIVTIFTGSMVKNGQYSNKINHYNVLRTIENMYGLPYAGNAANVKSITTCWK